MNIYMANTVIGPSNNGNKLGVIPVLFSFGKISISSKCIVAMCIYCCCNPLTLSWIFIVCK